MAVFVHGLYMAFALPFEPPHGTPLGFPTSGRRCVPAKNTSEHVFDYCPHLAYMLGSD